MEKRVLSLIFTLSVFPYISANNSAFFIESTYKDGYFWTTTKIKIDASDEVASQMIDNYIYQLGRDLPKLFS